MDKAWIRRNRKSLVAILCIVGATALVVTALMPPRPRLVWNRSDSAPRGIYLVSLGQLPEPDGMVVAWLPQRFRDLAARRHYLPSNVPLVKRAAAVEGDVVCAQGAEIRINGQWIAVRRRVDSRGRAMPAWSGCEKLGEGDLFLLMDAPRSFDGRYFGVTRHDDLIGKARLLWSG